MEQQVASHAPVVLWVLLGLLGVLMAALGFLLQREFKTKDDIRADLKVLESRWITSADNLASATADLGKAILELRAWVAGEYVTRPEFDALGIKIDADGKWVTSEIDRKVKDAKSEIVQTIEAHKAQIQRELDSHKNDCPVRR